MATRNDFRVSRDYEPEDSGGGSIAFWKDGEKIWIPENDFVALLEDDETRDTLVEAMKTGKIKAGETAPQQAQEVSVEPEGLPEEIPQKPAMEWDETEPEAVFDKNMAEAQKTEEPASLPKSDATGFPKADVSALRSPAMDKIKSRQVASPYSSEGRKRGEQTKQKITPQNFDKWEQQNRANFRDYMKKYDILKTITPKEVAERKIEEGQEEWFEEFAQNNGRRGMNFALIDDYKKDKDPEMKEFISQWQAFSTKNKEAIYDMTNQKFHDIRQSEKEDIYQKNKQTEEVRQKMEEVAKQQREANDPEAIEKKMIALAKAKEDMIDASPERQEALGFRIKRLESELSSTPEAQKKRGEADHVAKISMLVDKWNAEGVPEETQQKWIKEINSGGGQ